MRKRSLCPVLAASLIVMAAGCSKTLAPLVESSAERSAAAPGRRDVDDGGFSRSFRVQLRFVGPVVSLDRAFQPRVDRRAEFFILSSGDTGAPLDTVPTYSVLRQVRWRNTHQGRGNAAIPDGGEYIDEIPVIVGDASRDTAHVFPPGVNEVTLEAPERAGGGTVVVRFFVGFAPRAWWAGPDPALFPQSSDGDGRAVDVSDWAQLITMPSWPPDGRRYFAPDSFAYLPSQRLPVQRDMNRRTFYEIHGDRVYARAEGDTVHQNAWVVFCNGGFDRDSRYVPRVDPLDPGLPPGFAGMPSLYAALLPHGLVGSPSSFKRQMAIRLENGNIIRPSTSSPYPNFDPSSVFREPHMASYWRTTFPGKTYAAVLAIDADGLAEQLSGDLVDIADRVDSGGGSPRDLLDRQRILTFFVRPAAVSAVRRITTLR